jgi:hypothetical protein
LASNSIFELIPMPRPLGHGTTKHENRVSTALNPIYVLIPMPRLLGRDTTKDENRHRRLHSLFSR